MMPPPIRSVDWKLVMLRARDDVALAEYTAFDRKKEAAVLAAIAGGKSVEDARDIADQLYAADKDRAWARVEMTGKDLYEYKQQKIDEAMKPKARPWWQFWP